MSVKHGIAIFASGGGSNADKLLTFFKNHPSIEIRLIVTNVATAGVHYVAEKHCVPSVTISKSDLADTPKMTELLSSLGIDFILLAGFLLFFPIELLRLYPDRVINIHPSLLPKYGGKGMYGLHVHKAVQDNCELFSGITIHLVNEEYDKGKILFQASCDIGECDTAEDISHLVLDLEHKYFASVVEIYILSIHY